MKKAQKQITNVELKVGNIVQFCGARFEIFSTQLVEDHSNDNSGPIMVAMGKWLSGAVVAGYFGPRSAPWNFQGNRRAVVCIEIAEELVAA